MGIFDKFKTSTAIDRLSEEKLYEQVAQELKAGKKREGIWVKAMAKTGGDLNKAESMYIELRVQAIKDETNLASEQRGRELELESERKQAEEKRISNKQKECLGILKYRGYKVTQRANTGEYTVFDKKPNNSHICSSLESLCKYANTVGISKTKQHTEKVMLTLVLSVMSLFILFVLYVNSA